MEDKDVAQKTSPKKNKVIMVIIVSVIIILSSISICYLFIDGNQSEVENNESLCFEISLEKTEFYMGEMIRVNFTLTNKDNMPHNVTELDYTTINYTLYVAGMEYYYHYLGSRMAFKKVLNPGESMYYSSVLPIKYGSDPIGIGGDFYLYGSGDYYISAGCYPLNSSKVFFHICDDIKITLQNDEYRIVKNNITRILNIKENDMEPSIFQNINGTYVIIWESGGVDYRSIYHSTSEDGVNWSEATPLLESEGSGSYYESPSMVQDENGKYWLAYTSWEDSNSSVFVVSSYDLLTWTNPVKVSENNHSSCPTLVWDSTGKYWLSWGSYGEESHLFLSSSVNGVEWTEPFIIPNSRGLRDNSFLIDENNVLRVVFISIYGTYSTTSSHDGITWSQTTNLSSDFSFPGNPQLVKDSNNIYWSVWDGIECSISSDCIRWGDPIYLLINASSSSVSSMYKPYIFQDRNGTYWVVGKDWYDDEIDIWVMSFNVVPEIA